MILLVAALATARAGCVEPKQQVQSDTRTQLEGEVRATVLGIGGGAASGDSTKETQWSTQLASQQAIDNQWYLYYLCEEYESGRLAPTQYCEISSALWQRITGVPTPVESCIASTPPIAPAPTSPPPTSPVSDSPASDTPSVATPSEASATETSEVTPTLATTARPPAASPPAQTMPVSSPPVRAAPRAREVESARWEGLIPGGKAVDVYGPIYLAGVETYYLDNRMGCLSKLDRSDAGWRETMLIGASCSPWSKVDVQLGDDEIVIAGDDMRFAVEKQDSKKAGWSGDWSGSLYVERQTRRTTSMGEVPLEVSFDDSGQATTHWPATMCSGTLQTSSSGKTFREYVEAVRGNPLCISGATITLYMLGGDAMLAQWISPGAPIATYGVLHAKASGD